MLAGSQRLRSLPPWPGRASRRRAARDRRGPVAPRPRRHEQTSARFSPGGTWQDDLPCHHPNTRLPTFALSAPEAPATRTCVSSRGPCWKPRQRGWPRPAVYTEIGLSGWHRPRSALGRLAGHLASGRHDAVIVADLSRISRDPADVLAFTVHCARCGVTVEAVEEGLIDELRIAALYARQPVATA